MSVICWFVRIAPGLTISTRFAYDAIYDATELISYLLHSNLHQTTRLATTIIIYYIDMYGFFSSIHFILFTVNDMGRGQKWWINFQKSSFIIPFPCVGHKMGNFNRSIVINTLKCNIIMVNAHDLFGQFAKKSLFMQCQKIILSFDIYDVRVWTVNVMCTVINYK